MRGETMVARDVPPAPWKVARGVPPAPWEVARCVPPAPWKVARGVPPAPDSFRCRHWTGIDKTTCLVMLLRQPPCTGLPWPRPVQNQSAGRLVSAFQRNAAFFCFE